MTSPVHVKFDIAVQWGGQEAWLVFVNVLSESAFPIHWHKLVQSRMQYGVPNASKLYQTGETMKFHDRIDVFKPFITVMYGFQRIKDCRLEICCPRFCWFFFFCRGERWRPSLSFDINITHFLKACKPEKVVTLLLILSNQKLLSQRPRSMWVAYSYHYQGLWHSPRCIWPQHWQSSAKTNANGGCSEDGSDAPVWEVENQKQRKHCNL